MLFTRNWVLDKETISVVSVAIIMIIYTLSTVIMLCLYGIDIELLIGPILYVSRVYLFQTFCYNIQRKFQVQSTNILD